VVQQNKKVNQEMSWIATPKIARKLPLIVDWACTNMMVGDQNFLQKLTLHEASIKGVHKDLLPLCSFQRGFRKGFVLSLNGMHIPFLEDLPVMHIAQRCYSEGSAIA
jgi:hypothetical protein